MTVKRMMSTVLDYCDNCETAIVVDPGTGELVHVNSGLYCPGYGLYLRTAQRVVPKRYTLCIYDGLGGGVVAVVPHTNNQVSTHGAARTMFKQWLIESGNNYRRSDGYGAPYADLHYTDDWDGISYGDCSIIKRYTRGEKGGITEENQ